MRSNTSMEAFLDDYGIVTVDVSYRFYRGECSSFCIAEENGNKLKCIITSFEDREGYRRYRCTCVADLKIGQRYYLIDNHGHQVTLQYRFIVKSKVFNDTFYYDGDDLGCTCTREKTSFALWAPTAYRVEVEIELAGQCLILNMDRDEKGVYRAMIKGDFKRATYVYYVHVNGSVFETIDPYSSSTTLNSRRSVCINYQEEAVEKIALEPMNSPLDAIIYECSVRDMTMSTTTGTTTHGKFTSLMEENTEYCGYPTALAHILDLGVTHVQLMPVYDFATVDEADPKFAYNWGYDPWNYFNLEGSYSSNPDKPYARIKEFRSLVQTFHQHGIRVVVDIVMNHHYDAIQSCYDKAVPYYYYRYNQGYLSNGSGCGNDLDSTCRMVRKMVLDNIKMWIEQYDVDGFRFDLMGILDIDTMNEVVKLAKSLKPDCMVYGEGWNMPTPLDDSQKAMQGNSHKMPEIGFFNDYFRDMVKGKTSEYDKMVQGYCSGNPQMTYEMKSALMGNCGHENSVRIYLNPTQSINYCECHDNATSWDKLKDCCNNETREIRILRHKMILASIFLAQGIPFLHSGQEFCRTKLLMHNTYNAPDLINQMDWDRRMRYDEVVRYTKDLIALRKRIKPLHHFTQQDIETKVHFDVLDGRGLVYRFEDDEQAVAVLINATYGELSYDNHDKMMWVFDQHGLTHKYEDRIHVAPLSISVLLKEKSVAQL